MLVSSTGVAMMPMGDTTPPSLPCTGAKSPFPRRRTNYLLRRRSNVLRVHAARVRVARIRAIADDLNRDVGVCLDGVRPLDAATQPHPQHTEAGGRDRGYCAWRVAVDSDVGAGRP